MPRATTAAGKGQPLRSHQATVVEKAALQTLNGGSLDNVIRVRGARQHNLRTIELGAEGKSQNREGLPT